MESDNPKLATITTATGDCRGVTILFNTPGEDLIVTAPSIRRLDCRVDDDDRLALYRNFQRASRRIGRHVPELHRLGALIAAAAYHVTFCDVWHPGTIPSIADIDCRRKVDEVLRGLPYSLGSGWPALPLRSRSGNRLS